MKWTFILQQKLKIALLLAAILVLITMTNFLERRNVDRMNASFASIYYDRLIPATDIFYLAENLYNKRLLMETYLYADDPSAASPPSAQLEDLNTRIDQLVAKYEKTYLVKAESEYLINLKDDISQYAVLENKILSSATKKGVEHARSLYENEGRQKIREIILHLESLTSIQSTVGSEIIRESKITISNSHLILTLQIALAIVIGLLIQAIVMASNIANKTEQNFHLN